MAAHKLTRAQLADLRRYVDTHPTSITPVVAAGTYAGAVHLGIDEGSYDTRPVCGALASRETETTDLEANCGACAAVVRAIGYGHWLKDEDGWTGIYRPRQR